MAISGNYAIVAGSHNRQVLPYVFERNNIGQWNKKQILVSNDLQTDDNFGYSIALTDNYAIVGAIKESHDVTGTSNSTENEAEYIYQAGAAYIFKRDSNGYWNQLQKIVPNDRSEYLYFGYKVAIKGDYAVIAGDQYTIHNTIYDGKGSAYIFERDKTNDSWNQVQKITSSDIDSGDRFGMDIAISGNYIVVAAYQDDKEDSSFSNSREGSIYIFERNNYGYQPLWREIRKIYSSDRKPYDNFGLSVDIMIYYYRWIKKCL